MYKRIRRVFKSTVNKVLNRLEDPIAIMEQVIADSREEALKLFTAYEEIKMSIDNLDKLDCDEATKKVIQSQKEVLEKKKEQLKEKINAYREKVIETQKKIELLRVKNKAFDSILRVQKNLDKFNFDSDLSAITRMEEKINQKEARIKAYDDLDMGVF